MTTNEQLIAEARAAIAQEAQIGDARVDRMLTGLANALEAAESRLAALTTGQEIDAPSVREAIGEVLADQEAIVEGVPVANDLALLQEITDAAILAVTSPSSRTAKRTGYENVASAVGEHSQKITARAALTTPQEGEARERVLAILADLDYNDGGMTALTVLPSTGRRCRRNE